MTETTTRPYGERHETRETLIVRHAAALERVRAIGGRHAASRLAFYGAFVGVVTPIRNSDYVSVQLCTDPGIGSMTFHGTYVPEQDYLTSIDGAEAALVRLARAVGAGFHPDTPGDGYNTLPAGVTATEVDETVEAAFATGIDVYALALAAVTQ